MVRGGYPLTAVDKEKNVALLKTKGGNMVAATQVCTPGPEPAAWDGTVGIAAGSRPAWRLREAASSVAHEAGAKPPEHIELPAILALGAPRWPALQACCATLRPFLSCPAALQDPSGRVFMFDRAGNLYYDTEDPRTGLLVVGALSPLKAPRLHPFRPRCGPKTCCLQCPLQRCAGCASVCAMCPLAGGARRHA